MIELRNVYKRFESKVVLDGINYSFSKKGVYYLKGESGSGKTTLFNVISNRYKCEGEVVVGEEVFYLSFNSYLLDFLTVNENVLLNKSLFKRFDEGKVGFSIDDLKDKRVSKLSLGERQRVGLYIAFASNCKIVLFQCI